MKYVNIVVRNKIARTDEEQAQIVCGNSDYTIKFDFDEEWSAETVKTARFIFASNGKYIDVQFSGDECHMPVISDTTSVLVGVFAGNLCTTTGALIHSIPCITDPGGTPVEPTPDVYAQLMERFNAMVPPAAVLYTAQELTDEQKAQVRENIGAADKNATGGGGDAPSGGGGGTSEKAWAEILNADVEEATASFTLSDLGGLTDILILWRGLINAAANNGGYAIYINEIPITDSSAVPVAKAGAAGGYGNTRLHYNGLYWECLKSNGGSSATLKNVNQVNTLNNLTMGVGACEALMFWINATGNAAVSGNLTVYGR